MMMTHLNKKKQQVFWLIASLVKPKSTSLRSANPDQINRMIIHDINQHQTAKRCSPSTLITKLKIGSKSHPSFDWTKNLSFPHSVGICPVLIESITYITTQHCSHITAAKECFRFHQVGKQ